MPYYSRTARPDTATRRALAAAASVPFWQDDPAAPEPTPPLHSSVETSLLVVGGGYTGLWTALQAKEDEPDRDIVVLEARTCGWAASGRNGGFCAASLTHGLGNGLHRYPAEIGTLERLGQENLDGIEKTLHAYGIDAEFERTGELDVAVEPWQLDDLRAAADEATAVGRAPLLLDRAEVRAEIDSPLYLGGLWSRDTVAMVHPAKLAWGLRRACLQLGVRIFENTPVQRVALAGSGVQAVTPTGLVRARRAALATSVYTPRLLRRMQSYVVPVWDYAIVTEPLTPEHKAAIGWRNRQGVGDAANQFHYYRLTADDRILWGGFDAIYGFGNATAESTEQRERTLLTLATHFAMTFPQLEGIRFTHAWGGLIDTSSRFSVLFGTAHRGRVAYAVGYTGLGVGASRFGGRVLLDLLSGAENERTRLEMVRRRPLPFPPEPLRYAGIQATRWSLARADRRAGRRNMWLRALDRLGVGFDS
ncbi:MAG TPA: FAD-dependent oxidoreductase [Jiangellales bacterium]|nr:FAD-dependent oxidoreductase [Jiangellales bacterium]